MTKETSQKIKNMSFVCALLVVSIHITWYEGTSRILWYARQLICDGIARIAVPFFFVVSGYFLAKHFDERGWWQREVKKRIRSLVIPYVFCILITFALTVPLSIVADILAHRPFGANIWLLNGTWAQAIGIDFCDYPSPVALWYVRCLFVFCCFGGLFHYAVRRFGRAWLILIFLILCSFSLVAAQYPKDARPDIVRFLECGISLSGILFFSTGVYIRLFRLQRTDATVAKGALIIGITALVAKTVLASRGLPLGSIVTYVMIVCLLYGAFHYMPSCLIPDWLTSTSFPIFLFHLMCLNYLGIFFKHIPIFGEWFHVLACWTVSVAVPILAATLLRRFCPKVASVLFGGR